MKNKVLVYIVFLVFILSIPWINALMSSFTLEVQLEDREIILIGSHGQYKMNENYYSDTRLIHAGYYASIFNTLYLIKVKRTKLSADATFDVNEFVRGQQTFILLKLDHKKGRAYQIKHIEEDPRKGITQYPVTFEGDLGIL